MFENGEKCLTKTLPILKEKKRGWGRGETCKGRIRFSKMQNAVTKK